MVPQSNTLGGGGLPAPSGFPAPVGRTPMLSIPTASMQIATSIPSVGAGAGAGINWGAPTGPAIVGMRAPGTSFWQFTKPGFAKMAGRGVMGAVAAPVVAQLTKAAWNDPNSYWDDVFSGALSAGTAGAIGGSAFGPVGTLVGGGLGALVGGLQGFTGNKDKGPKAVVSEINKQRETLTKLMSGLDPEYQNLVISQLDSIAPYVNSKSEVKAAAQQLATSVPQLLQQQTLEKKQAAESIAIQSMMAQFLQPYLDNARETAMQEYALTQAASGYLPPAYKAIYEKSAGGRLANTNKYLANLAYQMAQTPNREALELQQRIEAQYNNALISQMVGQAVSPQSNISLDQLVGAQQ
jgi:hypothetical protein